MSGTTIEIGVGRRSSGRAPYLKELIGSGDKIGLVTLPFLVVGVAANALWPTLFTVGDPPPALRILSVILLVPGLTIWIWSVFLILARVPKHELITGGPYRLVKHPLYTGVSLLVLPWAGILMNTWLGALLGVVVYVASRVHAPEEERALARTFGAYWDEYTGNVMLPWL